jgi:hypothetical protein
MAAGILQHFPCGRRAIGDRCEGIDATLARGALNIRLREILAEVR